MTGSHNLSRPSYKRSTGEGYRAFYERVERAFEPEEMTKERLKDWLRNDSLADQFSLTSLLFSQIEDADTIEELRLLKGEVSNLPIHREKLTEKIEKKVEEIKIIEEEEKIAESVAKTEAFAEERGIELTERIIGRIETWKDGSVWMVIREKGSFKARRRV